MLAEGVATRRGRARRAASPRRAWRGGCEAGAARAWPRSPRAARSPTTRATRSCWSPTRRTSARSTRTSRSSPWRATSSCSATAPGASAASRAARVRVEDAGGAPLHDPVLARRGPGAHARAVRRGRRGARGAWPTRLARRRRAAVRLARATRPALDRRGALLARDYVAAAQAALGAVPTADDGGRRALLRRGRRHAARHPRALRRPHQPRLGPGAAQAVLPQLRLRAAGRGHRRRRPALARARSTASRSRRCSRCCTRAGSRSS